MFIPISGNKEKAIRKVTYLRLKVSPHIINKYTPDAKNVKHSILMCSLKDYYVPLAIFSCNITLTREIFMLTKLDAIKQQVDNIDEAASYLLLSWVIEDASKWTVDAGKKRILIQTRLPHATDLLVEHGYEVREVGKTVFDKNYRGLKTVNSVG